MQMAAAGAAASPRAFLPVYRPHSGTEVLAMFAAANVQPYAQAKASDRGKADAIWVFYRNGTFEQFANLSGRIILFSEGAYRLSKGRSFMHENNPYKPDWITIKGKSIEKDGALVSQASSLEVRLGASDFVRIGGIERRKSGDKKK